MSITNKGMNLTHPLVKGYFVIALAAVITEYYLLKLIYINLENRSIDVWDIILSFEALVPFLVMGFMLAANRKDTYKLFILNRVNLVISIAGIFATIYVIRVGIFGVLYLSFIALFQAMGAASLGKFFYQNYESRS